MTSRTSTGQEPPPSGDGTAIERSSESLETTRVSDGFITDALRELKPTISVAQQRIAQLALADPAGVAELTIGELAAAADTSIATVQRLCRLLQLTGYAQFRVALAAAGGRELSHSGGRVISGVISADDNIAAIIEKVAFADARAVEDTAKGLNVDAVADAVHALASARRIDIYGVGTSAFVAMDFHHKLHQINRVSFAWQDQHMALASASLLTSNDVALGISYTGSTRDTIEPLAEAKRRGATTIALTNYSRSPIVETADIVLTTASRETTFRADDMASRLSQLTVIDILFVAVAQTSREESVSALDRIREAMRIRQMPLRPARAKH